jgi:hypothetical protein
VSGAWDVVVCFWVVCGVVCCGEIICNFVWFLWGCFL